MLLFRYLILFITAIIISFSEIFDNFFLKLTIYPVNFLLNFSYSSIIIGNEILFQSTIIRLIPACIAVSAYFLFFILNLSTPMKIKTRINSLLFICASLLVINILRIYFLSILLINDYIYFDAIHKFIWYFMNIVIVLGLWFLSVYLHKIKEIPIYSDFKYFLSLIRQ